MAGGRSFADLGADASDLDLASQDRLQEAELLRANRRYGTAIALGLYALEIRLKHRTCKRLDLDQLPKAFEVHELEGLLTLSGLSKALQDPKSQNILTNWNEIVVISKDLNKMRYSPNHQWSQQQADQFFDYLLDPVNGVLPWILNQP